MTAVESPVINSKELADRIRQKLVGSELLILLLSNKFLLLLLSLSINCIIQTFDLQNYHSVVKNFNIDFY